jgi:prepilin-type N-terminal cleavage/methylation domain-containing protein
MCTGVHEQAYNTADSVPCDRLPHNDRGILGHRGFSLIELMIVVAILGILGAAVGVYINTSQAKLKSAAFNMGTRFKQAKFEAIKLGRNVYLDFDFDNDAAPGNGFTIWVDINGDAAYDTDDGDYKIGEDVVFQPGMEIYTTAASGGPDTGLDGETIGDGVTADNERFLFQANGNCTGGTAYVYFSRPAGGGKSVAAGPWAISVNSVGRIQLADWKNGAW